MQELKLIQTFKKKDIYKDLNRPFKDILTDFVNETFLKYNYNEVRLLKLIYKTIQPALNKYGLLLVFKGGNTMRLVNNNFISKYFPKGSDEIIKNIFQPFLKQSDNDFTIYIDPNIINYDTFFKKINYLVLDKLDIIRDKIDKKPDYYFDIFNLKRTLQNKLFRTLKGKLNDISKKKVNKVTLIETTDKEIYLANNNKTDIEVYENIKNGEHMFYNSINFSLEFKSNNGITSFGLLRTKVNFEMNNKLNLGGELIDISFPTKYDTHYNKLNTKGKYDKFIKDNIIKINDKINKFNYNIVNLNYIIKDLLYVLFLQNKLPWDDRKYKKRMARMIYFIFLDDIDNKPISDNILKKIKKDFSNFIIFVSILDKSEHKINNKNIKLLIWNIKNIIKYINNDNKDDFINFLKECIYYSNIIINIIDEILKYQKGKVIIKDDIFNLNVV